MVNNHIRRTHPSDSYTTHNGVNPKRLQIDKGMFKTAPGFTVGAIIVLGLIVALYSIYWQGDS